MAADSVVRLIEEYRSQPVLWDIKDPNYSKGSMKIIAWDTVAKNMGADWTVPPDSGYLLGDSGYPCRRFLLTPYRNPAPGQQTTFNIAHQTTRVMIEMSFGILKNRLNCLRQIRMSPERAVTVIASCVILHNIARYRRDTLPYTHEATAPNTIPYEGTDDGSDVHDNIASTFFYEQNLVKLDRNIE